ncbi:MAG TPA: YdcF family protein [Caulobacteraceae bacterium]
MKSLALLLILVFAWVAGLLAFAARIERSTPPPESERAQGIVALTGRSNARIAEAMQLLEDRKGQRLLISGVNPEATREDIRSVARAPSGLFDCCVDLGFSAADTAGNARETAVWARRYGFKRLIVVTSDYHLPRSLLELKGAMPEAELQGYPVRTEELDSGRWWRAPASSRRMITEYSKYVVILAREAFLSLGPRNPEAGAEPADLSR